MDKAVVRLIRDIIGDGKPCSKDEWVTISKALAEANQPSHNSDYTAALEREIEMSMAEDRFDFSTDSIHKLATRLNSVVKAQQNCA